jgi:hypothetical protein
MTNLGLEVRFRICTTVMAFVFTDPKKPLDPACRRYDGMLARRKEIFPFAPLGERRLGSLVGLLGGPVGFGIGRQPRDGRFSSMPAMSGVRLNRLANTVFLPSRFEIRNGRRQTQFLFEVQVDELRIVNACSFPFEPPQWRSI